MDKIKKFIKKIPGWVVIMVLFGTLYATGWHTEAIGQVQRMLLATGFKKANVSEPLEGDRVVEPERSNSDPSASMPGSGFLMVDLEGNTVPFENLKGKVVFMNIWATWCPPCIAEMPNIQSLYKKVNKDRIAFVMLSVDKAGIDKVRKFNVRKGYDFPVYLAQTQMPQEFSANVIPTTFIINPEGEIVSKQEGMAEYDTKEVRDFLESMVNY